jgi:GT2 family glycosyltransferase
MEMRVQEQVRATQPTCALAPDWVAAIVINWNGWQDTVRCLESLFRSTHRSILALVVDNASQDSSVDRIVEWAHAYFESESRREAFCIWNAVWSSDGVGFEGPLPSCTPKLVIVRNSENSGFARGVNIGLRIGALLEPRYFWLLNNDTEVAEDCATKHIAAFAAEPSAVCATSKIVYADDPNMVWNCGGWVSRLGLRRYHGMRKRVVDLPATGFRQVTFVTGCSMFLRASILSQAGMLCEDFFFGEEDIEFSRRLRKLRLKSICVYDAVVRHKVSESFRKVGGTHAQVGRAYIYYLNRFVHFRRYWPSAAWNLWRGVYTVYISILLRTRLHCSIEDIRRFVRQLIVQSTRLRGVDRETFFRSVQGGWRDAE